VRITLVIENLGGGGAERVASQMINYWADQGKAVTLITLASEKKDFYATHSQIHRIALDLTGPSPSVLSAVQNNVRRIRRLRGAITTSRPDCIISFMDRINVLTLLASSGLGMPVIASERIDPRQHNIGSIWTGLRRLVYPQAAAIVVLTEGVRPWAEQFGHPNKVHVIPNSVSVPVEERSEGCGRSYSGRTIIAMGRLDPQKGFDLLLRAFARCVVAHPEWSLLILGEGDERGRLEALAVELGIAKRVTMPGRTPNPFKLIRAADLFVLSSRYEGFPNALVEAMACGLPVIAADCRSGPRDIIRDGVDGVLVPPENVDMLTSAMDSLMMDPAKRQRLGANALEVSERFSTNKIMNKWDDIFCNILSSRVAANH